MKETKEQRLIIRKMMEMKKGGNNHIKLGNTISVSYDYSTSPSSADRQDSTLIV